MNENFVHSKICSSIQMMAELSDLDSMKSLEEPVFGFLSNEIFILQILLATFLIHFFLSCILNGVKWSHEN